MQSPQEGPYEKLLLVVLGALLGHVLTRLKTWYDEQRSSAITAKAIANAAHHALALVHAELVQFRRAHEDGANACNAYFDGQVEILSGVDEHSLSAFLTNDSDILQSLHEALPTSSASLGKLRHRFQEIHDAPSAKRQAERGSYLTLLENSRAMLRTCVSEALKRAPRETIRRLRDDSAMRDQ